VVDDGERPRVAGAQASEIQWVLKKGRYWLLSEKFRETDGCILDVVTHYVALDWRR
jgi:hypothetical protein